MAMPQHWVLPEQANNLIVLGEREIIIASLGGEGLERARAELASGVMPADLAATSRVPFADLCGVWNDPARGRFRVIYGKPGVNTTDIYVPIGDRSMRDAIFAALRESLGAGFHWKEVNPTPWERAKAPLMIAGTVAVFTLIGFFGTLQALDPNFKETTRRGAAGRMVLGGFGRVFGAGGVLVLGGLIVVGLLYWAWRAAYPATSEPMEALLRRDLM